jgi:hypothetical protein
MKCKYCEKDVATQADYDVIPEGEGDHLCWSDFGERCIEADAALDNARAEIDTLKRQVEVLVRRIERLNRNGYACEICEVTVSELHCVQRCAELVKAWSLEQAKKGGGG